MRPPDLDPTAGRIARLKRDSAASSAARAAIRATPIIRSWRIRNRERALAMARTLDMRLAHDQLLSRSPSPRPRVDRWGLSVQRYEDPAGAPVWIVTSAAGEVWCRLPPVDLEGYQAQAVAAIDRSLDEAEALEGLPRPLTPRPAPTPLEEIPF